MKSSTIGYKPLGEQDSLRFSASLMFKSNSLFVRILLWHHLLGKILWVSLLGVKDLPLLPGGLAVFRVLYMLEFRPHIPMRQAAIITLASQMGKLKPQEVQSLVRISWLLRGGGGGGGGAAILAPESLL